MKINNLIKTVIMAGAVLTAFSCKKEKEEEALPQLNGMIKYEVPRYALQGQEISFTLDGIKHPENKEFGYVVTVTKSNKEVKRDTVKRYSDAETKAFTYTFPTDSLGAYSINATAFAAGYSSSVRNKSVHLVGNLMIQKEVNINGQPVLQTRPNKHASITGSGIDTRDGKYFEIGKDRYFYAKAADGNFWTQNNLFSNGGKAFEGENAMSGVFGNYYNYEEAVNACPDGWKLPDAADWKTLVDKTGEMIQADPKAGQTVPGAWTPDVKFNGTQMWEYWPADAEYPGMGDMTNSANLCIIPAGYANVKAMKFDGVFEYAAFWSADENPDNTTQAKVFYIYNYENLVQEMYMDKESFGASVRCIKK